MGCRGVLYQLTDTEVDRLLAASKIGDRAVRDVMEDIEEAAADEDYQLTEILWNPIHRCLSDGTLDFEGGTYPLNRVILGGQNLYPGDDYLLCLVSPPEVRDVATALATVTDGWMEERFFALTGTDYPQYYLTADWFDGVMAYFEDIREFYQRVAEAGRAVVFYVDL